ncbi:MAG: hypothetical protein ABIR71_09030 [Chthoniobacterales bacterium]
MKAENSASVKTGAIDGEVTAQGNSEFGHRQGDAATRTTGSQNSQFSRHRGEEAKVSPTPTP